MTGIHGKAEMFRELHRSDGPGLLLPNVWDAASARLFEAAGFPAIGTTSAGVAYTRGVRDGQRISRKVMLAEIANVVRAVNIPVTADIEAGYGADPNAVAETVEGVLDAGAVGINLEDSTSGDGGATPLFPIEAQSSRIAAARAVAEQRAVPLVINARTDTFLLGLGNSVDERLAMTAERGAAYLAAGADLVFVPLVIEPDVVRRIAQSLPGPISVMALPGAPPASELFAAGARRVSIGQIAMLASMGLVARIAQEMREHGTWNAIGASFYSPAEAEQLFQPSRL